MCSNTRSCNVFGISSGLLCRLVPGRERIDSSLKNNLFAIPRQSGIFCNVLQVLHDEVTCFAVSAQLIKS